MLVNSKKQIYINGKIIAKTNMKLIEWILENKNYHHYYNILDYSELTNDYVNFDFKRNKIGHFGDICIFCCEMNYYGTKSLFLKYLFIICCDGLALFPEL